MEDIPNGPDFDAALSGDESDEAVEAIARNARFDQCVASFTDLARMMAGYRDALLAADFERIEAHELVVAYQQSIMLDKDEDDDD